MGSADRLDEALGTVDEMEFAVWVPVFDRKRHRVAWVIPYMFVNTQLALCGGRETYGFPKRLGRITIDDSNQRGQQSVLNGLRIDSVVGTGSLHAACAEMVLSIVPTPDSPATLSQLPRGSRAAWIEIGRRAFNHQRFLPPIAPDHSGLANALACAVDQIIHPVPETGLIGNIEVSLLLAGHMATGRVPMVFLNQFRDAVDPKFACYQAIVEVNNRMTRFGHGGFLEGSWNVTLGPRAGARLEQELGVSPQPQQAGAAFWLDFDFVCGFEGFLHPTFGIG